MTKIVILTIERRMNLAQATKQSLLDVGVLEEQIEIIKGYDKDNYPDMKRPYLLVVMAFFNWVLPYAIDNNTSIFYTECGTLFNENPFELLIIKDKINWLGYLRNMKHYIVGAKLIYFPLSIIKEMNSLEKKPRAHIDRAIRNYGLKHDCLIVADKSHTTLQDYESAWGTKH